VYGAPDAVRPISDKGGTEKSFLEGFHSVRPDAKAVAVDEQLRDACFGVGSNSIELDRSILVIPNLGAPRCRSLVDQRGIRYLLSATGENSRYSSTVDRSSSNSIELEKRHLNVFELHARAFDTQSGVAICQDLAWELVISADEFMLFPFPLSRSTRIDEPAYWSRVAWLTGARLGTCFVQPAKVEPETAEATR